MCRRNRYTIPSRVALQGGWAGLAIELAWHQLAGACGLASEWVDTLATAVRAVQTLTTQLTRPVTQRIVNDNVGEEGR